MWNILRVTFFNILFLMLLSCKNTGSAEEDLSYYRKFKIPDFNKIHSPVNGSNNEYLILGNIPINKPDKNIPKELAGLFGRWEGYDLSPPVSKDYKLVFILQEITKKYISGFIWRTTNLQFPYEMIEFKANIIRKKPVQFEIKSFFLPLMTTSCKFLFTYDKENNQILGEMTLSNGVNFPGPGNIARREIILSRDNKFKIYKDYDQYLASKRIFIKEYKEKNLQKFGKGYMFYLPEGYEKDKNKKWPLIVFLHGSGDRGNNIHLIAKASPFMIIREKQDIPFIIVAPLFIYTNAYRSFPTEYMDNFLTKILKEYQVDTKRVYFTGLSMGGEATYRYAIYHPEKVTAIAPLCAPLHLKNSDYRYAIEGWPLIEKPLSNLRNMPVWIIGGGKDPYVPKKVVLDIAGAVKEAGSKIKVTILEENDHDVWTDNYSEPSFYNWFLQYKKIR